MIKTKTFTKISNLSPGKFTLYYDDSISPKAFIIYIHGGGLFYGSSQDLPSYHIEKILSSSYNILAIDYPLAPERKLDYILDDITDSIEYIINNKTNFFSKDLPFFIWGRSAGAYLALLSLSKHKFAEDPLGLISYYGYGFFKDDWDKLRNPYYLSFPKIEAKKFNFTKNKDVFTAPLEEKYHLYVYARQTGKWSSMLLDKREKYFYSDFSLRSAHAFNFPLFLTHAINDPDVPFAELNQIRKLGKSKVYIAPVDIHDFDRDTSLTFSKKLISQTIDFLEDQVSN
ncbi:MAG: alpha/beta hydrolase [Tissierellia bacterium]|nr:alpha/beta hydrolase [Tissierellia bacterium]